MATGARMKRSGTADQYAADLSVILDEEFDGLSASQLARLCLVAIRRAEQYRNEGTERRLVMAKEWEERANRLREMARASV